MNYALSDYTIEELQQRKAALKANLEEVANEICSRRLDISHDLAERLKRFSKRQKKTELESV